MSDTEEQESILDNLSKTRQLWNSKADLGAPSNFLVPKSPTAASTTSPKQQLLNGSPTAPIEVVRADDQVVEDYELPDIKSMKSQWETPKRNGSTYVPLPSAKSPAVLAKEKSKREHSAEASEPVNRVEPSPEEEVYEVELTKLKAQFESAARAASKSRPKSPKAPLHNSAIKEQVTRSPSTKQQPTGNSTRRIRFEDEMTSSSEHYATEQRAETGSLAVDLTGIKSQFESRKDEHLVIPALANKKAQPERSGFSRTAQATVNYQSTTVMDNTSSHGDQSEPVKSSEPVYDEMVGEESVKDRLKRYKSLTESPSSSRPVVVKRSSQKREVSPVVTRNSVSEEVVESSLEQLEVVRSPPAGTKETPDYVLDVNLRQAKAKFESSQPPASRSFSEKRSSRSSVTSPSGSSDRTGRSSSSTRSGQSRNSSRHSTASSRSPSSKRSKSPLSVISTAQSEDSMTDVVKPPPAGTKETPDYVPAVKVSSMKSMFESNKSSSAPAPAAPAPRRVTKKTSWVNNSEEVVRPPSPGTKEKPDYNLSSDFLKSRAAMFDAPPPQQYTPKNKLNKTTDNVAREVVNREEVSSDTNYQLSQSLKDTKKMFEQGGASAVSPDRPTPRRHTETVQTPKGEVVRPPPAGTRESDVVPASDINSVRSRFENQEEAVESNERKKPIDIRTEAEEAQQRESEIAAEKVEEAAPTEDAPEPVVEDQPEPEVEDQPEPEVEESEPQVEEAEPLVEEAEVQEQAPAQDSYNDSEQGEYVAEKDQEPPQDADEDQAAGVVPVRVAVPDTNEDAPSDPSPSEEPADDEAPACDEAPQDNDKPAEDQQESSEIPEVADTQEEVQEQSGTLLREEDVQSSDDDYDKPHFKYGFEEEGSDVRAANSQGDILLDFSPKDSAQPASNGSSSLLDLGSSHVGGDLLFSTSASKSGNILLLDPLETSEPEGPAQPGGSGDLLNGFDIEQSIETTNTNSNPDPFDALTSSKAPESQSDPFNLFSSMAPPVTAETNSAKDPFDLFG